MGKAWDARFDTLKGVLILTVVFGHFFTHDASHSIISESLANFIYSFHMPLFVFISGYFTKNQNFWKGVIRISETLILYQLIKGIAYHYSPLWLVTMPAPMLWYLVALIVWRLLSFVLEKVGINITWHFMLFLIVLSVAAGLVSSIGREFALSRIIVFAPYFFMGEIAQKTQFLDVVQSRVRKQIAWGVLVLTLVFSVFFAVYAIYVRTVFGGTSPYPESGRLIYACARLFSYVTSSIIAIAIIRLFSFDNSTLGFVGKDSLKYYMFHGLCLMAVEFLGFPWSTAFALLYATAASVAIFFFNKTILSDFAISPVSFIINYRKQIKNNNG